MSLQVEKPAAMDKFFLPDEYRTNSVCTFDSSDERNYWHPSRVRTAISHQRQVYEWADCLIKQFKCKTVADVGCGFAYKLNLLHAENPQVEFWGIDQPNAIRLCQQHYKSGRWLGVDFENDPAVPDMKFDLVISSDVIEHLENPDLLLDYIRKITAPDGHILISTPERDRLRGINCTHSPNKAHVREWNDAEFSRYLTSRGFSIIEHRILIARKPSLSFSYLRKAITRLIQGKSMRFNQAVLLRNQ